MNNCILMAEIVEAPQLRYTADNQTPIAEFVVKFPGLREGDMPGQMKAIGWGNLAQEIQEKYRAGDRVLLEGRLGVNTLERPEGFKEKRIEMTVQRVSPIAELQSMAIAEPTPVAIGRYVGNGSTPASTPSAANSSAAPSTPAAVSTPAAPAADAPDYDDIPF
ncbi:MAG: single-stranded DNA-binding protein [Phormidesmis sp.]